MPPIKLSASFWAARCIQCHLLALLLESRLAGVYGKNGRLFSILGIVSHQDDNTAACTPILVNGKPEELHTETNGKCHVCSRTKTVEDSNLKTNGRRNLGCGGTNYVQEFARLLIVSTRSANNCRAQYAHGILCANFITDVFIQKFHSCDYIN